MVSEPDERPVLEETDAYWSPYLDSELKRYWEELNGLPALVELVTNCFGAEPWRGASEDYRLLLLVLAFQHQPGEQWGNWLQTLEKRLRARQARICAAANGPRGR